LGETVKLEVLCFVIVYNYGPGGKTKKENRGHVTIVEEKRVTQRVLVEKPQGRRPLEKNRHRWKIILTWALKNSVWRE
jgi:hypothetical protein